jgi:hypothetical protein
LAPKIKAGLEELARFTDVRHAEYETFPDQAFKQAKTKEGAKQMILGDFSLLNSL